MIARVLLLICLSFASAVALATSDLNLDLTPEQILTGEADETLRDLGARAVEEGATLVVTAPSYWHELIGEQISAGAGDTGVNIEYKDTVIEAAWVRSREAQRAAAAVNEPAPQPEPEPEPASTVSAPPPEIEVEEPRIATASTPQPQAVEPQVDTNALAEQARLEALNSLRESRRAPQNEAPAESEDAVEAQAAEVVPQTQETQVAANEPATVPPPEPVSASPSGYEDEAVEPAVVDEPVRQPEPETVAVAEPVAEPERNLDFYRADLEERTNFGRPIRREMVLDDVKAGDELFTSGPLVAVVRRNKAGINTYLLADEVDINRNELSEIQPGRYLVEAALGEEEIVANVTPPVDTLSERDRMERLYNRGRNIRDDLDTSLLREDDVIYTSENTAVVIRREQIRAKAYWLTGELDLSDERLRKEGSNKYRVLIDFR